MSQLILMMSMVGTLVYLALKLMIVLLSEHLSERAKYNILLVTMITFLIPVTLILPPIETSFSNQPIAVRENYISTTNSPETDTLFFEENTVESSGVFEISKEISFSMKDIMITGYSVGVLILGSVYLLQYLKYKTKLKHRIYEVNSLDLNGKVYKVAWIDEKMSPFVLGVLKPMIIIPEYLRGNDRLDFILLHETTHINRKDTLIKNVAQLIHIVNWFNPFFFLLKQDLFSTMEKSCDEMVVSSMDQDSRKNYSLLILNVVEVTRVPRNALGLGFSNSNNVKERIENIMSHKNMNRKQKVVVSLAVVAIVISIFNVSRVIIPVQAENVNHETHDLNPIQEVVEEETVALDQTVPEETESDLVSDLIESESLPKFEGEAPVIKNEQTDKNSNEVKPLSKDNVIKEEPKYTPQSIYWPVIGGEVLCGYNCSDNHRGISFTYGDKPKENGSFGNVYAVASGKVIEKSFDSGRLGEYLVIAHDNGDKSLYAHLNSGSSLGVGTRVTKDTVIAHVGMTGKAYYPNVYFEFYSNGVQVDPTNSLIGR